MNTIEQWKSYAEAIKKDNRETLLLTPSEYNRLCVDVPASMHIDGYFEGLLIEIDDNR